MAARQAFQFLAIFALLTAVAVLPGVASGQNSGSVTPPYQDLWANGSQQGSSDTTCTTGLYFYNCVGAYTSTGQADSGVQVSGAADTQSSQVLFDQNQGHGVSLSSGGSAVTMGTLVSANGYVYSDGVYSQGCGCWSGQARLYVFWSLNYYNPSCPCYQTETYNQIIWDTTNPNEGSAPVSGYVMYPLTVTGAPAGTVGGGAETWVQVSTGTSYSWFSSQLSQYFSSSYYLNIPEIEAASWTVSLTASNTHPNIGQSVTLTASATADVGSFGLYLNIYDQTAGSVVASCSSGSSCSASVSEPTAQTHTYIACVDKYQSCSSTGLAASSGTVSVTWGSGGSNPSISITQSGSTLTWHISGLTPSGSFTVSESTSQGFNDQFGPYTASSSGTDSRSFNYGGGTPGDVVTLKVTDVSTGKTAQTSYTVQSSGGSLSIYITQSGTTLDWHISGLTVGGSSWTVSESTSQGFDDNFGPYSASSSTDSRAFNYGGGTSGDVVTLTVTQGSNSARTSYTVQ